MKRSIKLITVVVVLFISFKVKAQENPEEGVSICIEPQVSFPLGKFKEFYKTGFGGIFQVGFKLNEKTRLLVGFGGGSFKGKEYDLGLGNTDTYSTLGFMQLNSGVKYHFTENLFISGEIGAARSVISGETTWGFSYMPAIGYNISPMNSVTLKYSVNNIEFLSEKKISFLQLCLNYYL